MPDEILEVENFTPTTHWLIRRMAKIDAVTFRTGSIRYRVQVWDEGRQPFLVQWFNDPAPATDFLDHLQEQAFDPSRVRS